MGKSSRLNFETNGISGKGRRQSQSSLQKSPKICRPQCIFPGKTWKISLFFSGAENTLMILRHDLKQRKESLWNIWSHVLYATYGRAAQEMAKVHGRRTSYFEVRTGSLWATVSREKISTVSRSWTQRGNPPKTSFQDDFSGVMRMTTFWCLDRPTQRDASEHVKGKLFVLNSMEAENLLNL